MVEFWYPDYLRLKILAQFGSRRELARLQAELTLRAAEAGETVAEYVTRVLREYLEV